ncbi:MAG: hypothetical protein AAFR11_01220 [Pseudomonadota bacterium]
MRRVFDRAPSDADCDAILDGVIERTLPKARWNHAAHVVFAVALLGRMTLEEAEETAPRLIRLYNEATGVSNTADGGYHHTITVFFLRSIEEFLAALGDAPLAERCAAVLASPIGAKDFPERAYERALLESPVARLGWVEPRLGGYA